MHCTLLWGLPSAHVAHLVALGACTVLYCMLLYSIVLYSNVLYCILVLRGAPLSPCGEFGSSGTLYCTLLYFTTVLYCTLLLSLPPHPMLHLNIKSRKNLCCGFTVMVDFIWIIFRRTNGRTDGQFGGRSKIRIRFYISKSP